MQPSPIAETSKLLFPSLRFCISETSDFSAALISDFGLCSQLSTINYQLFCLLRFQRSHVDGKPVLHIGLEQSFVGFVDLLDRNDLDIGGDVIFAAKVEHLLGFGDAANHRAGETASPRDEGERRDRERLCGGADQRKIAVDAE